ncbi:hypothetical protein MKW94_026938 [Papaver nudicaule]|uniref:Uncharacterized protein n=1 Tax=Papaver nudicaule TaxID=74823 RepID=A0AA41VEQ4_PAPNU|nr:hypothetical protein [Papaver nudicaule]
MLNYDPPNTGTKARLLCKKAQERQPLVKKQIETIFSGAHAMAVDPKQKKHFTHVCGDCKGCPNVSVEVQTRVRDHMTKFVKNKAGKQIILTT